MRYLTRVKSNVKGGVDVELGARTLIVGENSTCKSAITQSIEFLHTGRVSDIVGRSIVADVNTLLTLGDGERLEARGLLSNDTVIELATKGKKLPPAPFPNALPLRDVKEALGGNVDTVRKFFLRLAAGVVSRQDVEERIPAPLRSLFDAAVATTPTSTAPADLLLHALDHAKRRARELTAEAKAATAVTNEVTTGAEPVREIDLTTARDALALARAHVEDCLRAADAAERIAATVRQADEATTRVAELEAKLASIPPPADADRVRTAAIELARFAADSGCTVCPCCRSDGRSEATGAGPFTREFWNARATAFAAKAQERAAQLSVWTSANAALTSARRAALEAEYALNSTREASAPDAAAAREALEKAREAASAAEERVIQLERSAEMWTQARKARDAATSRGMEATQWAALSAVCKSAIAEVLGSSVEAFRARVQRYLPDHWEFHITLHEEDREVCRYGFSRAAEGAEEKRLDSALGGGEWAALNVALACAYVDTPGVADADTPRVVIPDDRSWGARTLADVLDAFDHAPCQVIVATTTMPTRVPAGWVVIRTDPPEVLAAAAAEASQVVTRAVPAAAAAPDLDPDTPPELL